MSIDNGISGEFSNSSPDDSISEITAEKSVDDGRSSEKEGELSEGKKRGSPQFTKFLGEFDLKTSSEDKIRLSIEFMRAALTHQGAPRFRDFWEGRKICLPLFKENLQPKVRSQLWGEYIELSGEARRLKAILDEQSAFAVEQIELALQAIERDIEHYDTLLSHLQEFVFPQQCVSLKKKQEFYNQFQRELQLLNTLASRISGLRKEVVKTEMRIRAKNKLLERLSLCGDRVFPRRKELIKAISEEFAQDVEHFVTSHFNAQESQGVPIYALREEIKALQSIAKILTLNTHCFTQTRVRLSECWDKLKDMERDRKKEIATKRQAFKQNFDAVMERISAFAEACKGEITLDEANRQAGEISTLMRSVELGRDEVKVLRDELAAAKNPIIERAREQENERQRKEREAEVMRREKTNAIKEQLEQLLFSSDQASPDEMMEKRDDLLKEFEAIQLSKTEKQIVGRQFKQLKDLISERKERVLMALSEDDLKSLELLKSMLDERKERRTEIKDQLESYRKALGGSGFDFEKAMMYRELIEAEKASLDKINASIEEIEDKIAEIEG